MLVGEQPGDREDSTQFAFDSPDATRLGQFHGFQTCVTAYREFAQLRYG
jgi:hypothetical protein